MTSKSDRYNRKRFVSNLPSPFGSRSKSSSNTAKGVHPYGEEWPRISLQVKARDNYTCRAGDIGMPKCGARFPPPFHHLLHAHHLIPYAKCKSHNLRNLFTLCVECHGKEHGRSLGNITHKQKMAAKRY